MLEDYQIVKPTKGDIPELLDLWEEQYSYHQEIDPVFYVKFTEDLKNRLKIYLTKIIEDDKGGLLVARERERESSSTILGFITFGKEHDEYFDTLITDFGVLKEILVTEKARSRGIGRKLIKEAESVFKDSGLENIMIQCSAFNPRTLRIYEEAGYTTRQNLLYKKI